MKRSLITSIVFVIAIAISACSSSSYESMSDDYNNNSNYRRNVDEMSQRTGESSAEIDREIQSAVKNAGWDF